jgi:hypothetical protein
MEIQSGSFGTFFWRYCLRNFGTPLSFGIRAMWISFLVGAFLLQHAIQGWCPLIQLFRRLGFRTQTEIANVCLHRLSEILYAQRGQSKSGVPRRTGDFQCKR